MWFTDEHGNRVNTDNKRTGINSSQMHDKGSDVIEDTNQYTHEKSQETISRNMISEIFQLHDMDEIDEERQSKKIAQYYRFISRDYDDERKKVADNFFIYICGYSLKTILEEEPDNFVIAQARDYHESDADSEKQSEQMYYWYENLSDKDKRVVDTISTHLSGYELNSIIKGKTMLRHDKKQETLPDVLTLEGFDALVKDSKAFEGEKAFEKAINHAAKTNGIVYTQVDLDSGERGYMLHPDKFYNKTGRYEVVTKF
jgi:hypothetical protein